MSLTSDLQPDLIILQYCCLSISLKPVANIIVCFAVLISDCHELYFLRYSFVCAEMVFGSSRVCLSCCSPFRRSQANYKGDTDRVVEQSIIHTQRHYWYALSVLFSEPSQFSRHFSFVDTNAFSASSRNAALYRSALRPTC